MVLFSIGPTLRCRQSSSTLAFLASFLNVRYKLSYPCFLTRHRGYSSVLDRHESFQLCTVLAHSLLFYVVCYLCGPDNGKLIARKFSPRPGCKSATLSAATLNNIITISSYFMYAGNESKIRPGMQIIFFAVQPLNFK